MADNIIQAATVVVTKPGEDSRMHWLVCDDSALLDATVTRLVAAANDSGRVLHAWGRYERARAGALDVATPTAVTDTALAEVLEALLAAPAQLTYLLVVPPEG